IWCLNLIRSAAGPGDLFILVTLDSIRCHALGRGSVDRVFENLAGIEQQFGIAGVAVAQRVVALGCVAQRGHRGSHRNFGFLAICRLAENLPGAQPREPDAGSAVTPRYGILRPLAFQRAEVGPVAVLRAETASLVAKTLLGPLPEFLLAGRSKQLQQRPG